jgi:hypothetical protein
VEGSIVSIDHDGRARPASRWPCLKDPLLKGFMQTGCSPRSWREGVVGMLSTTVERGRGSAPVGMFSMAGER